MGSKERDERSICPEACRGDTRGGAKGTEMAATAWPAGPALDPLTALATLPAHGSCSSPFIFPTTLLFFFFHLFKLVDWVSFPTNIL